MAVTPKDKVKLAKLQEQLKVAENACLAARKAEKKAFSIAEAIGKKAEKAFYIAEAIGKKIFKLKKGKKS